jgi:hypothetical protein
LSSTQQTHSQARDRIVAADQNPPSDAAYLSAAFLKRSVLDPRDMRSLRAAKRTEPDAIPQRVDVS